MLNEQLSQVIRRWVYRVRPTDPRGGRSRTAGKTRLRLEQVEERLAPAVVPAVTVDDTRTISPVASSTAGGEFDPQAAIDPANPNHLVLVTSRELQTFQGSSAVVRPTITIRTSTDGGANWGNLTSTPAPTAPNGSAYVAVPGAAT